jgi:TRAP-type C4-dicarboxylate transport system permease large subunit
MNNAIGLLTPPVGTVLNVVAAVGRISIDRVTVGVMPFLIAQIAVLFLLVFVPELVTVPAKFILGR